MFILDCNGILYFEIGWLLRVTDLRFIFSFSFSLSILKCSLAESLLLEIFGWKDQTSRYIVTYLLAAEDRLTSRNFVRPSCNVSHANRGHGLAQQLEGCLPWKQNIKT